MVALFGHSSYASNIAKRILEKANAKGIALTPMQILKLVYIAHGWMLGKYGKPLLSESVEAWQYGPVVPSVYHAVKQYGSSPVTNINCIHSPQIGDQENEILDLVVGKYGPINGIALSTATHQPGTPWSQTQERFPDYSMPISNDVIRNFYETKVINTPVHSAL